MSVREIEALLKPKSIAVIGASSRPKSIGSVVMQNLLKGGFQGVILPVNPHYDSVHGLLTYSGLDKLPIKPDLAILCTPVNTIPNYMEEIGKANIKVVIIMSKNLDKVMYNGKDHILSKVKEIAKDFSIRILGPNSLGVINPHIGLNATFAHTYAIKGDIAFISQSNSLALSVLDWANTRGIGFSYFISLGEYSDIDFADIIDYLGRDPNTRSILLSLNYIKNARKFISSARSTSRDKPIVVIKGLNLDEVSFTSLEGIEVLKDLVYDASFRRAGMLRVSTFNELFDSVETMAKAKPIRGDKVAIISNGHGPANIIKDTLLELGGKLAKTSKEVLDTLKIELKDSFKGENPFILEPHASGIEYSRAVKALLQDKNIDALIVIHAPSAFTSSEDIAGNVISSIGNSRKNVFTVWLGEDEPSRARKMFALANIPTYETPDEAARIYMDLVKFRNNQEILMETPESIYKEFLPDRKRVESIIKRALKRKRYHLNEAETIEILSLYGIPVVDMKIVLNQEEAIWAAKELGFPVVIKGLIPEVFDKISIGGVVFDVENEEGVKKACESIINRVKNFKSDFKVQGFIVQRMYRVPDPYEVFAGVFEDDLFGPTVVFGQRERYGKLVKDIAVGLPPLNMTLAKELIQQTKVFSILEHQKAELDALRLILVQMSQLILDFPRIKTLWLNPLVIGNGKVKVLNGYIDLNEKETSIEEKLAIKPYPKDLEEEVTFGAGKRILIRPIRPEDEPEYKEMITSLSPEDLRMRFFTEIKDFPHQQLARWTQIDYDREMAFVAVTLKEIPKQILGEVRVYFDSDNTVGELAIVVRSDLKRKGLGTLLMDKMIKYCKQKKVKEIVVYTLKENIAMQALAKKFSFKIIESLDDPDVVELRLNLDA